MQRVLYKILDTNEQGLMQFNLTPRIGECVVISNHISVSIGHVHKVNDKLNGVYEVANVIHKLENNKNDIILHLKRLV